MIKQYPHYLFIEEAAESVQDEQGNWTEMKPTMRFISMCRAESDGKGTEYQVAGGEFQKTTAVIQCPKTCPKVSIGSKVIIANDASCNDVRILGVCLNFDASQLHTRLWV